MEVNIFDVVKQPSDENECHHADMINTLVTEEFYKSHEFDPLNYILREITKVYFILIMLMFLLILRHMIKN